MCVCVCVCVHNTYTHIHIHTHMYTLHTYIHTYAHTNTHVHVHVQRANRVLRTPRHSWMLHKWADHAGIKRRNLRICTAGSLLERGGSGSAGHARAQSPHMHPNCSSSVSQDTTACCMAPNPSLFTKTVVVLVRLKVMWRGLWPLRYAAVPRKCRNDAAS